MSLNKIKEKLLKNDNFRKEYYRSDDLAARVADMVQTARLSQGLTQAALAKKLKTKQSAISRLERGASSPSLSFLEKIAAALGFKLSAPQFVSPVDLSYSGGFSWQLGNCRNQKFKPTDIVLELNNKHQ